MNGTIDDRYFEWLYSHIGAVKNRNPSRSYWDLCGVLYRTPFRWFVRNDDNRAEDGKHLRQEFMDIWGTEGIDTDWLELDCSMLEMLIALADRVAFQDDGTISEWFWRFMKHLELDKYSDAIFEISIQEEVEEALERINDRTYLPSGEGGLFPLKHPSEDQRKVELWYQMSAYLIEKNNLQRVGD